MDLDADTITNAQIAAVRVASVQEARGPYADRCDRANAQDPPDQPGRRRRARALAAAAYNEYVARGVITPG
jgi:hypothetical protein